MAILEKIRVKFGVFISVIIALALLSFIIDPNTLDSAMNAMSSKYDVGSIAGKGVSYTEYQQEVDRVTTINEILTGTSAQNEELQLQIRNTAWQEFVDRLMFVPSAKDAGIKVGESELVSLMTEENVSPVLAQNTVFMDETGAFSQDALNSFIQQVKLDETGRLATYWNYLQNTVHNQQYYMKYGALFAASNMPNALQLKEDVAFNNTTADVDYFMVYYPVAQDTTVTVSSKEIESYYKNHKEFFKQTPNRDVEYVVFEITPSAEDIEKTSADMDKAYAEFATTDNMKSFLLKNSDQAYSEYWYKEGELRLVNSSLDEQIFGGEKVSSIVRSGNTFYAAREMDSKKLADSVFVKHILLQDANAAHTADSLVTVLNKGGNFSNLVAAYSTDQSSAADGELGSIGWMTQTYMIPGFESVIEAPVGKPFVLNTQFGSHVVLVTEKTTPVLKKQIAILEKETIASKETINDYYSQANTFSILAGDTYEGYVKAVDSTKVYSHRLSITEATDTYGSISNAKEITRWAFDAKKAGKASNIITVDNKYFFVAALTGIHEDEYAPVSDVAESIRQRIYSEKVQAKTLAEVTAKIEGKSTIEAAAEVFSAPIDNNEALSFAATTVDPAIIGAASVAPEGSVYGPVAGSLGVYVLNVSNKQVGTFYTEEDAKNLATQKAQYLSQLVIPVMSLENEVVDNRARFY